MQKELIVKNVNIGFFSKKEEDFISLTDIAKYKNKEATGLVISHWMSIKYNIEFIRQNLSQAERLEKLNQIAVIQMKSLMENKNVKKLS